MPVRTTLAESGTAWHLLRTYLSGASYAPFSSTGARAPPGAVPGGLQWRAVVGRFPVAPPRRAACAGLPRRLVHRSPRPAQYRGARHSPDVGLHRADVFRAPRTGRNRVPCPGLRLPHRDLELQDPGARLPDVYAAVRRARYRQDRLPGAAAGRVCRVHRLADRRPPRAAPTAHGDRDPIERATPREDLSPRGVGFSYASKRLRV